MNFKVGDIVINIVDSKYIECKILKIFGYYISIENSDVLHYKDDFISLSEYRKQKINKLKLKINGF